MDARAPTARLRTRLAHRGIALRGTLAALPLVPLLALASSACRTDPTSVQLAELERKAANPEPSQPVRLVDELANRHRGPPVAGGTSGTARFTEPLYAAFDTERALATIRHADGFYREPANPAFDAVLDRVAAELREAGFGATPELALEMIETPLGRPAWTPLRAKIALRVEGAEERVLHAFDAAAASDRTMLPAGAPPAKVEGRVALSLDELEPGRVLATEKPLSRGLVSRARDRGAVAVLSASLESYNADPTGAERHLDAIQYTSAPRGNTLPVAQISPRSLAAIAAAKATDPAARVAFEAEVELAERPLRTLVATIVGAKHPEDAIVVAAHVQEPGACDNASGVAGVLEGLRASAGLLSSGGITRPARSLVCLFGNELEQSRVWLARGTRRTRAAFAADMLGESSTKTGAIALLERTPDPGALVPLLPDQHTAWGASPVTPDDVVPTGLAVVAREALLDVGKLVAGDWDTSEHPFEGGSDHAVFLDAGIPAMLFWHFPDFAYHTSLDRLDNVDPEELRRSSVALLAAAFALCDPRAEDLERHLQSLRLEVDLRVRVAEQKGDDETAKRWRSWSTGARLWLRELCLDLPHAQPGAGLKTEGEAKDGPKPGAEGEEERDAEGGAKSDPGGPGTSGAARAEAAGSSTATAPERPPSSGDEKP